MRPMGNVKGVSNGRSILNLPELAADITRLIIKEEGHCLPICGYVKSCHVT